MPTTIAVDGPVAAGKSVVSKILAERLGYRFLDTGAMYRALTWAALQEGVDAEDEAALVSLANRIAIDIGPPQAADGRPYTVFVEGRDVTWEIRSSKVERHVSQVSLFAGVRDVLVAQQRALARAGRIVVVGRDIGTVVLPDADLKIFLIASPEERARRRHLELVGRGRPVGYEEILGDILRRDQIDSERVVSPLRPAADALLLDTDCLTIEQVVSKIESLIVERDP